MVTDHSTATNFVAGTRGRDRAKPSPDIPPYSGSTALFANDSSDRVFSSTVDAGFTNAITLLVVDDATVSYVSGIIAAAGPGVNSHRKR